MAAEKKYRGCEGGTMRVHRRLLDSDPNYARRLARIEEHAFRSTMTMRAMRSGCTRIPVVVHVVYKTAAENVSQTQIDSQIAILNQDFRKKIQTFRRCQRHSHLWPVMRGSNLS